MRRRRAGAKLTTEDRDARRTPPGWTRSCAAHRAVSRGLSPFRSSLLPPRRHALTASSLPPPAPIRPTVVAAALSLSSSFSFSLSIRSCLLRPFLGTFLPFLSGWGWEWAVRPPAQARQPGCFPLSAPLSTSLSSSPPPSPHRPSSSLLHPAPARLPLPCFAPLVRPAGERTSRVLPARVSFLLAQPSCAVRRPALPVARWARADAWARCADLRGPARARSARTCVTRRERAARTRASCTCPETRLPLPTPSARPPPSLSARAFENARRARHRPRSTRSAPGVRPSRRARSRRPLSRLVSTAASRATRSMRLR